MVTYVVYTLEDSINDFFHSSTSVTRQQCDDFAITLAGGLSTPLQMQGAQSYTLTAGPDNSKLFQFREEESTIDMNKIGLAKTVHPEFVAGCTYLGTLGETHPLHVYEMETLPGTSHCMAKIPGNDMVRQRNTIKDLARFFAQSWNNDQHPPPEETATLLAEFESYIDLLTLHLPPRFTPNLQKVHKALPSLFSGSLPFVLSHGDLNTMNILADPETGHITGIVDWAEARILPFGFALYGLENILGWMDAQGWHYHDGHVELERLFWETFREEAKGFSDAELGLVRVARMAGLFYQYGFYFDGKGVVESVRVDKGDRALAYLDAFCASCEWAPLL